MGVSKVKVAASCSSELKSRIEKRAKQLEMSIPVYLKYAVVKEMEEEREKLCEDKDGFE